MATALHSIQRTLIIPDCDNSGISLERERLDIESQLLGLAGGFTQDTIRGYWLDDDGTQYHDTSARYTIVTTPAIDAKIAAKLPAWCALLRQEALFTSTSPVNVRFVTAEKRLAHA